MIKTLLPAFLLCVLFSSELIAQNKALRVFISNSATNSVKYFDSAGNYLGDFVPPGYGGLSGTQDILFLPDGSMLASGIQNNTVKRYDGISGSWLGNFTKGYALDGGAVKIRIGPDSLLYVSQWFGSNKVIRYDLSGNFVSEFTSIEIPLALGFDWDKHGNLYVAQFGFNGNGVVKKFDMVGNYLGDFVNSSILQGPTDLWFDENGILYVQDWITGDVRRYDTAGVFIDNWTSNLGQPEGMARLPNGNFLMPDWQQDRIVELDSNGNILGDWASGNGLANPNGIRIARVIISSIESEKENNYGFSVYPTSGIKKTVEFRLSEPAEITFIMTDMHGRIFPLIEKRFYREGLSKLDIQLEEYPSGIYFVQMSGPDGIDQIKIIIE